MLFLHTADLHLGRSLHDRSLIDDQRLMLDFLLEVLGREDYAGLLVSGDVYDRSIPSPEAVKLLGEFLAAARRRFPDLQIVLISGNHDSPERLSFGDELFAALGIRIASDPARSFEPIEIEHNGERCALFALPFLTPGSLRASPDGEAEAAALRSQRDLAREAADRLEAARRKAAEGGASATVLMAHLFAAGGAESESERVFLGTAERVDAALFGSFDYVALGHLHRFQRVSENAWYAGSPLAYSFDEADREKSFCRVEVGRNAGAAVAPIPIRPARRVSRLAGSFDSFMEAHAHDDKREDYLEISLSDGHLTENPLAVLRTRYPNLLSVRQDAALAAAGAAFSAAIRPADRRDAADDFRAFLCELYGEADEEKTALFKTIASEAANETAQARP